MPVDLETRIAELAATWQRTVPHVEPVEVTGREVTGREVTGREMTGSVASRSYRSRWLLAGAAVLVAALVGALVVVARHGDDGPVAGPASPVGAWAAQLDAIAASVVGRQPELVEIDRGSGDGIDVGMPVVDGAGLVGVVVEVDAGRSRVMLLTGTSHSVAVDVAGAVPGVARGDGAARPLVLAISEATPAAGAIAPGDVVETAGSARVPAGIPIGRIVAPDGGEPGVEPVADLDHLATVHVVRQVAPVEPPSLPLPRQPPPQVAGPVSLWLSAQHVPPGTELVAVLVDTTGASATFGVHAVVERWDGSAWQPFGETALCLDGWHCTARILAGPQDADDRDIVTDIGLSATPDRPGVSGRFTTEGLDPGWYRISQTANEGIVAAGLFEVDPQAARPAPLPPVDAPAISVSPVRVPPSGGTVDLQPLVPPVGGGPTAEEVAAAVAGYDETVDIERWDGATWTTVVAAVPLAPVERDAAIGRAASIPPLDPGAYRLVRSGSGEPHTGNLWVTGAATSAPTGGASPAAPIPMLAIGDSVMLSAAPSLVERGVVVDAAPQRQLADVLAPLEQLRDRGVVVNAVVVHAGTNGPLTAAQLDRLADALAGVPRVVVLTVRADRSWIDSNNALIRGLADRPNVTVLDWATRAGECEGDCFAPDGIHLAPDGRAFYTDLVLDALTG